MAEWLRKPCIERMLELGIWKSSPHQTANHCLINQYVPYEDVDIDIDLVRELWLVPSDNSDFRPMKMDQHTILLSQQYPLAPTSYWIFDRKQPMKQQYASFRNQGLYWLQWVKCIQITSMVLRKSQSTRIWTRIQLRIGHYSRIQIVGWGVWNERLGRVLLSGTY
jgi:hypothetical protein